MMRLTGWAGTSCVAILTLLSAFQVLHAAGVTLEYWSWDESIKNLERDEVIKPFEEQNPGVTVSHVVEPWGGYWNKLAVLNAAGTPPDVYNMSLAYLWDYANSDWAMNLEPFIRSLNRSAYFMPLVDDARYPNRSGEAYAFPFAWIASVLYFNRSMFDAAGVAYPDEGWDWEALRQAAKKLTRDQSGDGKVDQWGFVSSSSNELFDSVVHSFGGRVLDASQRRAALTEPKSIQAIQWLVDLIHKDGVAPPPGTSAGFAQGQLAMWVAGSYNIDGVRQAAKGMDWDIAMVPRGPVARVIYGGPDSVSVSKYTKHPKEALEFVRFLVGDKRTAGSFMGGKVPMNRSLATSPAWLERDQLPRNKAVILQSAQYIRGADFGTTKWFDWRGALDRELGTAFRGERSVQAAAAAASKAIDVILSSTRCNRCR